MRNVRFSLVMALSLTIVVAASGCVSPVRDTAGSYPASVSIRVDNGSRERIVVYLARVGSRGEKLGRVDAMASRVFRVPVASILDVSVELYSEQERNPRGDFGLYTTTPFRVTGAGDILWLIRDGQRLSRVTMD